MATRDLSVPLTLSVTTTGVDEIRQLQGDVEALAKQGGDAAPELAKLANEVNRLGEQAAVVQTLRTLSAEVEHLAEAEVKASATSVEMSAELGALAERTRQFAADEKLAKDAVTAAQASLNEKKDALKLLKVGYGDIKVGAKGYTDEVRKQQKSVIDSGIALRGLTSEFKDAKTATDAAAIVEARYANSVKAAGRDLNAATGQLAARNAALQASQAALEASGLAARDVAAAEHELLAAYNAAVIASKQIVESHNAVADAAKREQREHDRLAQIQIASRKAVADASAVEAGHILADYAKMEQAQRDAAVAAKQAGDAINTALGTVGVRSAAAIQAEIGKVKSSLTLLQTSGTLTGAELANAFTRGAAQVKLLERELRDVNNQLTLGDKAARLFSGSMAQFSAGILAANSIQFLVGKVQQLGAAFIEAVVQSDQMRRGLTAVYGSAEQAASQIQFLKKSSSEAGVAFGSLGGEFVKFSASMNSANIPLEQSNALFKAVVQSSASLGLSAEATTGALNALGQMASKGVVSMEELRSQLGDRLPGVMGLTAKAMGIAEASLIKLVESGQLATRDFIEPFTQGLGTVKAEADGLIPAFERFKGLLSEMSQAVGDAGFVILLTGALKGLGGIVGVVALGLSQMVEGLFLVGAGVAATAARLTGDTKAWEFFGEQIAASGKRLDAQVASLKNFIAPSDAAAASVGKHAVAMTQNTVEVVRAIEANGNLSAAQKLAALSTALAADATLSASAKIIQYSVASDAMLRNQSAMTDAFAKSAKAAEQQGTTLVALATLTGDATLIQKAKIDADLLSVAALDKVNVSQQAELDILTLRKAAIVADADARKLGSDAIKVQIDALDKLIVKAAAETDQSTQSLAAAKAELFARQLATEALKDNSAKLAEYKIALDASKASLIETQRLQVAGKATTEQVTQAVEASTKAEVLYKDALADTITNQNLATQSKSAALQLTIAQVDATSKHYEALAVEATRLGDTSLATYYLTQAKESEIKVLQLKLKLDILMQEAGLQEIELKKKLVDGTTAEGNIKLQLLDIETQMIKIKQAGNQAVIDQIVVLERQATALRNNWGEVEKGSRATSTNTDVRNTNSAAIDQQTSALEAQNAAQERANAAVEKAVELENKRRNVDKNGFTIMPGVTQGITVQTKQGIYKQMIANGLTETQSLQLSDGFEQASSAMYRYGQWTEQLGKQMNEFLRGNAQERSNKEIAAGTSGVAQINTRRTEAQSSNIVNINISGVQTKINTASSADSAALTRLLQQLSSASGRSVS
jgi:tape measure domain-containing protein